MTVLPELYPGILAIFVSDTGVLAKLYTEAIENATRGQVDGTRMGGDAFGSARSCA
ncbi:MAG: hypothetical protein M3Z96_01690 [Pseudomonadota bacterium]|nr:hypothetical protein [Pseudomonadota bacterium]